LVEANVNDVLIATPADIELLRKTDTAQAANWRQQQRAAFEAAEKNGMIVVGLNEDYCYVLRSNKDGV
jgi:predicted GNAT superfamily acetyltransferase